MERSGIESLTEAQKACLRLVMLHHSSKDIARMLDCSPHTVDNHLKAANMRLGVATRYEAARLLAQNEHADPRRALASQAPVMAVTADFDALTFPEEWERDAPLPAVHEVRATYSPEGLTPVRAKRIPLPSYWGEANDLSTTQRLGWIAALILGLCLSIGAIMASIRALWDIL